MVLGLALAIGLYFPLSQSRVGGLSLDFDAPTVLFWSTLLLVLGLVSAAVSLRRVFRIDPIDATVPGGTQ
jgi:ABC-type antimicrobial peptide transport system permease subunit